VAPQTGAPAAAAGTRPGALPGGLSRVPKVYLLGAAGVGVAGLALFMRKRSAAKNGQNNAASTSSTTTSPQDLAEATYDTSVYDAYNDLQSEYQGLQGEVNGLVQPVSPGNTNPNPTPVPTPTPPPLQGGNPPHGPTPPVPAPPSPTPKPPTTPPKPTPAPTKRTQVVGKWPAWNGSLFGIAQHYYGNGNQWPKIYAANKSLIGSDPNKIKPGQVLTIP
jgi:nucleoid-associated protein YgaU